MFTITSYRLSNLAGEIKQYSTTLSYSMKKITLLLLRHGERADEAVRTYGGSLGPRSDKDRMDPDLTEEGHLQASEAFEQILPFLSGKKVAIFSSPLKRTMATAAMIGMNSQAQLNIVLPDGVEQENAIPIVVMNGLSDCAAHVCYAGGAHAAVRDGFVDGAAMAANNCSSQSPIVKMMGAIPHLKLLKRPIQFYKEDGDGFKAMTGPIGGMSNGLDGQEIDMEATDKDPPSKESAEMMQEETTPVARHAWHDSFDQTLQRIVRLAAARDCDVCVLVTHREGIRDLVAKIQPQSRISTTYCCIGKFSASLLDGDEIHWEFHNVKQYQHFEL